MLAAEIYDEKQIRMIDIEEPTLQGSEGGDIIFQPELACLCGSDLLYFEACLLYTSPSPRDRQKSRMPSSA